MTNTCYSVINERDAMHVASVHKYDPELQTMVAIDGAGGLSRAANEAEGDIAQSWADNIWDDMLG
jgi:hypothetical protein